MTSKIHLAMLISLALAVPSTAISCYSSNSYNNVRREVHNRQFCTAFYEVETGTGTFGGADRDPLKMQRLSWDITKGMDCQLQHHKNNVGQPAADVWMCYCFTTNCNYPFTFEEFKARGFSLEPKITE